MRKQDNAGLIVAACRAVGAATRRARAGALMSVEALEGRQHFTAAPVVAAPVTALRSTPVRVTTRVPRGVPIVLGVKTSKASPSVTGFATPLTSATTPAQMRAAYGLGLFGASPITFNGIQGDGTGQTIAIIDAFNDPNAYGDLQHFDAYYNLPDPPSFQKVSQTGSQTVLPGLDSTGNWELEESLDIEWSHVMAPKANIILVECASASYTDLLQTGAVWAASQPGVSVVSMSFGTNEFSGEGLYDSSLVTPTGHSGVTFVASTGDTGAYSANSTNPIIEYPAASPNVLAVGGTTLTVGASNTYGSETGWGHGTNSGSTSPGQGGGGGGASLYEFQPAYQANVVSPNLSDGYRTIPDVSAAADPNGPGVAVYDSHYFGAATPWCNGYEGGTSLSAPLWAGMVAVVNQGRMVNGQPTLDGANELLPELYQLSATSPADFHDITSGNNGYTAGAGYDLVTGIGSPAANALLPDLVNAVNVPVVSSFTASPNPLTSSTTVVNLSLSASNSPTEVDYYIESNGLPGLQPAADTAVATVTTAAGNFAASTDLGGLGNGNYTFYAVAKNAAGISQTATVQVTLTGNTGVAPTLSLTGPGSAIAGASITLTASAVTDAQGIVKYVNFFQDSGAATGLQANTGGDIFLARRRSRKTTYGPAPLPRPPRREHTPSTPRQPMMGATTPAIRFQASMARRRRA